MNRTAPLKQGVMGIGVNMNGIFNNSDIFVQTIFVKTFRKQRWLFVLSIDAVPFNLA